MLNTALLLYTNDRPGLHLNAIFLRLLHTTPRYAVVLTHVKYWPSAMVLIFPMLTCMTHCQILDGLGLGPRGPPIPPPVTFSMLSYPVKRYAPPGAEDGHYTFIAAFPDDP